MAEAQYDREHTIQLLTGILSGSIAPKVSRNVHENGYINRRQAEKLLSKVSEDSLAGAVNAAFNSAHFDSQRRRIVKLSSGLIDGRNRTLPEIGMEFFPDENRPGIAAHLYITDLMVDLVSLQVRKVIYDSLGIDRAKIHG